MVPRGDAPGEQHHRSGRQDAVQVRGRTTTKTQPTHTCAHTQGLTQRVRVRLCGVCVRVRWQAEAAGNCGGDAVRGLALIVSLRDLLRSSASCTPSFLPPARLCAFPHRWLGGRVRWCVCVCVCVCVRYGVGVGLPVVSGQLEPAFQPAPPGWCVAQEAQWEAAPEEWTSNSEW